MKCLVTGASGFLGTEVTRLLLEQGDQVRALSRRPLQLSHPALEHHRLDLTRPDVAWDALLRGVDAVIHTAAKAGVWGHDADYMATNVGVTSSLLAAVRSSGVRYFVYTSSPSVVFDGSKNLRGVDETFPYPKQHLAAYPRSKQIAEQFVLAHHGGHLQTVSLRPHLIWGPGDPHFAPRLCAAARRNRLYRIGRCSPTVDVIHIRNAAAAHLLALERMSKDPLWGGRAFFLGQERPVRLWAFLDRLLGAYGFHSLHWRSLPTAIARIAGASCEMFFRLLPTSPKEPPVTRFLVAQLTRDHYFSHRAALQQLGYRPQISIDEGLASLAQVAQRSTTSC